jgi:hypothetical protein
MNKSIIPYSDTSFTLRWILHRNFLRDCTYTLCSIENEAFINDRNVKLFITREMFESVYRINSWASCAPSLRHKEVVLFSYVARPFVILLIL